MSETKIQEEFKYSKDVTEDEVLKNSIVDKLKDAWNVRESSDLDFVQKETIKFCLYLATIEEAARM